MKNVKANATVDLISQDQVSPVWRVEVTGLPPHAGFRVYFLSHAEEKDAAFEGIRLFCKEMSQPRRLQ